MRCATGHRCCWRRDIADFEDEMARLRIGDMVAIRTARGLAYAQYANKHEQYGPLLRVFGEIFPDGTSGLGRLAAGKPAFVCFFPLGAAVSRKIVSIAGNEPVPEGERGFPIFRAGVVDPSTGRVSTWWLWDGKKEWRVGQLTDEQRKLPIRGVWNDTHRAELCG
jgi:hypothetical protein